MPLTNLQIKQNVNALIDQGASDDDILEYLSSEGTSYDALQNETPQTDWQKGFETMSPEARVAINTGGMMGRSVLSGIGSALEFPIQAASYLANKISPSEPSEFNMFNPLTPRVIETIDKTTGRQLAPKTTLEKYATKSAEYASGGGVFNRMIALPNSLANTAPAISAAVAGQTAQEMGASPAVQTGVEIGTGILTGLKTPKTTPKVAEQALNAPNTIESVANAVAPARQQFAKEGRQITQNYRQAKKLGRGTIIDGNQFASPLVQNITKGLEKEGAYLGIEGAAVPTKITQTLEEIATNPSGQVDINRLGRLRQNITRNLYKETNTNAKTALKVIQREFDNSFNAIGENAILSGNPKAVDAWKNSVIEYAKFAKRYGTDIEAGQSRMFENIIKKNALDNEQLASAVLGSSIGKDGSGQIVSRLLQNSGDKQELVKQNLKNGVLSRVLRAGESKIIGTYDIYKVKKNIRDLIENEPTLAKTLFSPDEIKSMTKYYQAPLEGSARTKLKSIIDNIPLLNSPLAGVTKALSKNPETSAKDALRSIFDAPELRGAPQSYSDLIQEVNSTLGEQPIFGGAVQKLKLQEAK